MRCVLCHSRWTVGIRNKSSQDVFMFLACFSLQMSVSLAVGKHVNCGLNLWWTWTAFLQYFSGKFRVKVNIILYYTTTSAFLFLRK